MITEAEMKQALYAEGTGGKAMGLVGSNEAGDTCRASLRERVSMDLHRARREQRKAERLAELDMLLDKHPEVARILDLLEEVRG